MQAGMLGAWELRISTVVIDWSSAWRSVVGSRAAAFPARGALAGQDQTSCSRLGGGGGLLRNRQLVSNHDRISIRYYGAEKAVRRKIQI